MFKSRRCCKTPINLQMEAVECGAAALATILAYHGRHVVLSRLREECGVNREGSRAGNIIKAATRYGLEAEGVKRSAEELFQKSELPVIAFWKGMHCVVVEGCSRGKVSLNDPAFGRRQVTEEEFVHNYAGLVLEFTPGPDFKKGEHSYTFTKSLRWRMGGVMVPMLTLFLLSLVLALPSLAVPVFSKIFVDNILVEGVVSWSVPLVAAMGATLLFIAFFSWLQQVLILRLQAKLAIISNTRFIWRLLRLPAVFFSQRYAPEITSRCHLNETVATLLSSQFTTGVLNLGMAFFYLSVMVYYNTLLSLVGLITIILNVILVWVLAPQRHEEFMRMTQATGKAQAMSMGTLQCIDTVKSQGMEQDTFAVWAESHATSVSATQRLGMLTTLGGIAPIFMTGLYNTVILGAGALLIRQGAMTIGELVAFQVLANMMMVPVNQLSILAGGFQHAFVCMKRLDDVLDHEVETEVTTLTVEQDTILTRYENLTGSLEIKNVTFGYNRQAPPLIENFSLSMAPGSRVALVGPSGSGKSTIAKIVAGLYQPWWGEILFDSTPREQIPEYTLKSCVSMVDQNIFMFEGSFRENLTLWNTCIPDEDVIQACRDADLYSVLIGRPDGLDGYVSENGSNLSGGQRQCMEIARSLVRNPSILILDEATNALDAIQEHKIDLNIRQRGFSCLIVANRLSTIRDADEIIVLDCGKVVDRGTHEELIQRDGLYKKLVSTAS